MTKIDIFSGFLGAGKTTLIKKLITEAFAGQQVVLIENEFGEIGIDGGFLKESGIQINELNAGCICCSLVGDFRTALQQVVEQYHPDRIVIEPSGVGKLSDVTRAVEGVAEHLDVQLNSFVTVADVNKVKMYMKNFGEFYDDQISHASCILLSRTQTASEEKIAAAVAMLREKNPTATIVTTAWDHLTGEQILKAMSTKDDFKAELIAMAAKANEEHAHEDEEEEHEHHHHHDHENGVCSCGHHHDDDDDDDEDEHEHHHHDNDEHDHDDHCCCGHHHDHDDDDDEHEHHHHGDHEHGHHHHHDHDHDHEGGEVEEYGIGTFVYYRRKAFDLTLFDEFVARKWPRDVVRAKGICYFADEPDMCYVFEQAGQQKTVKQAGQWLATMPADQLAELRKNNPQLEKEWDDEYGDRMIKIVFIGQHIKEQKNAIIQELDKCLSL